MNTDLNAMLADEEFAALPQVQRERCLAALNCLENLPAKGRVTGTGGALDKLAHALACSVKTAARLWYAYRGRQDWRVFVDGRSKPAAALETAGANSPRFKAWVARMFETNQRSTAATVAEIQRMFRLGSVVIPGFEKHPGGFVPKGCSETSLRAKINAAQLANIRLGLSKAARRQLPALMTRANLLPGQVYEFDDVWHDHYVVSGKQVVRVLEFGAVDVASACRVHWGHIPATVAETENGPKRDGLKQAHFILFLAYLLRYVGYHKDGVRLVMEHGTATLPERVRALLEGSIPGLTVVMGGMHDQEQMRLQGYAGSRHGNPRAKTHIESQHNGIHNLLGHLAGQVGMDRQHHPEATYGMIKAQEQVELWRDRLVQAGRSDLAAALQNHFLTMPQFSELLITAYTLFNSRTDHKLEGWERNTQLEYQVAPGIWQPASLLTNNGATRLPALIAAAAQANPALVREVKLSPRDVWERGKADLARISLPLYVELLRMAGGNLDRRTKVHGGLITLQNRYISPAPIHYQAACITMQGRRILLGEGEEVRAVLNPYAPEALVLLDERGGILGECPQAVRADLGDMEAVYAQIGRTQAENVARMAQQRARWQGERARVQSIHAANRALMEEAALLPVGAKRKNLPPGQADIVSDAMAASDIDVFGNLS